MPAGLYLFIPFWKIKVIKRCVNTSLKKQRPNTIQILWIVKNTQAALENLFNVIFLPWKLSWVNIFALYFAMRNHYISFVGQICATRFGTGLNSLSIGHLLVRTQKVIRDLNEKQIASMENNITRFAFFTRSNQHPNGQLFQQCGN